MMLRHSKFVRDLSDRTKISIRQLEAEWKVAERQLNLDILMDPNKYSHLKVLDGTMAEEVARRVEANIANPDLAPPENQEILGVEPVPMETPPPPETPGSHSTEDLPEEPTETLPEEKHPPEESPKAAP